MTVSAVNSAGTSVRSDPEIFSESVCESVCVCVCLSVCERVGMYRYMSHSNKILIMCYICRGCSTFVFVSDSV